MRFAPELAGPCDPMDHTPPRHAGSARRTTTVDVVRPDGPGGPGVVDARGRDLVTATDGTAREVAAAHLLVDLDPGGVVVGFGTVPPSAARDGEVDLGALVGAAVPRAFRREVAAAAAVDAARGGLWHQLLDDMVGAHLVSGLAQQYEETHAGTGPMHEGIYSNVEGVFAFQGGICAGWDADASMLRELREAGTLPVSVGPVAPDLEGDDPLGWHGHEPLALHSVCRRRRVDLGPVAAGGTAPIDVHFRDSHRDGEGIERVVHEYTAVGVLDVTRGVLSELEAEARVLPWKECPAAVASAGRAVGVPLGSLRDHVRHDFRGVTTCTHLNDMVRFLADLPTLAAMLDGG